jgi:hypothetical protein
LSLFFYLDYINIGGTLEDLRSQKSTVLNFSDFDKVSLQ